MHDTALLFENTRHEEPKLLVVVLDNCIQIHCTFVTALPNQPTNLPTFAAPGLFSCIGIPLNILFETRFLEMN